jgi:hypothetical protein
MQAACCAEISVFTSSTVQYNNQVEYSLYSLTPPFKFILLSATILEIYMALRKHTKCVRTTAINHDYIILVHSIVLFGHVSVHT